MNNKKTRKIVWAGLFAALTVVATIVIQIPSPTGGYLNAGDALVLLSAFLLGPAAGAIAAGLGSALADIFAGYVIYAPATFIIKALMALVAGLLLRGRRGKPAVKAITGGVLAELIMVSGYYLFEALFITKSFVGALAGVPANCIQAAFGVLVGTLLYLALVKIPYVRDNF